MGSETLPEIIVCEHYSLCNPQMQVKAGKCREEAIYQQNPEPAPPSLGQTHLECKILNNLGHFASVLWSREDSAVLMELT